MCCRIYGSKGTCDTHYGGTVNIRAKTGGYRGGSTAPIYKDGAVTNIKSFCASIESKKYINNAQEGANSTLTSILGRIAAYENRPVTWDEMTAANVKMDLKLNEVATDNLPKFIKDIEAFLIDKGYTAQQYNARIKKEREEAEKFRRELRALGEK